MTERDPAGDIGRHIRTRRKALGLSLEALARRSGVSSTMLSEVERSVKNPTVKLAYQIARALECSLTELLEDEPPLPVTLVRAAQRRTLVDPDTGVARHGLSSRLLGGGLELAWYELPPGQSSGAMEANLPGMVEFVTVLEGELSFRLGETTYELGPGDSVTYGPQSTCEYVNRGNTRCVFVLLSDRSRTP